MPEDVMPYGAEPPETEYVETVEDKVDAPEANEPPAETQEPDYKKSYEELHKKFGEHSNIVGELRKQNQQLMQEVSAIKESATKREEKARDLPPPTDYEKQLREIAKRAEDGDLTLEQALLESNKITYERTRAEAEAEKQQLMEAARNEVQSVLQAKDSESVVNDFHKANPEFETFRQEGRLDQLKAEDPLLDDLSAYWKAQALTEKESAAAEFERGKQEALRIKGGSEKAGKVIADAGTSMQNQSKPNRPPTESELKASMLAKLAKE